MKINLYRLLLCTALLGLLSAEMAYAADVPSTSETRAVVIPSPEDELTFAQRYGWLKPYLGVGTAAAVGGRVSRGIQTGELAKSLGNLSPYLSEAGSQIGYGIGALGRGASAVVGGIGSGLGYGAGALGATARHAWEAAAPEAWIQKAIPQIIQQAPTKLSALEAIKLATRQGLGAAYKGYTQGIQQTPTYLMPKTGEYDAYIGAALAAAAALPLMYRYQESLTGAGKKVANLIPERIRYALTYNSAQDWYDKAIEASKKYDDIKNKLNEISSEIRTIDRDDVRLPLLFEQRKDSQLSLNAIAQNIQKYKEYALEGIRNEVTAFELANEKLAEEIETVAKSLEAATTAKNEAMQKRLENDRTRLSEQKQKNTDEISKLESDLSKKVDDIVVPKSIEIPEFAALKWSGPSSATPSTF